MKDGASKAKAGGCKVAKASGKKKRPKFFAKANERAAASSGPFTFFSA